MNPMTISRGDVVIVDFLPTNPAAQIRPALVVQNDRDNSRTDKTIIVQISTNLRRAGEDTHLLIDQSHTDWSVSGLRRDSVVNCSSLAYVAQADVIRVIGHFSETTMVQISLCLKSALGIVT